MTSDKIHQNIKLNYYSLKLNLDIKTIKPIIINTSISHVHLRIKNMHIRKNIWY